MTALAPVVDLTWINDDEVLNNLEVMVRQGMSVDQCARILDLQASAVAFVLQSNPKIKAASLQAVDYTRHNITRKVVNKSDSVLDVLYDIVHSCDEDTVKTRDRIAAANLYLNAAGIIGNKAAEAEKRMNPEQKQSTEQDKTAQFILDRLIDRAVEASNE